MFKGIEGHSFRHRMSSIIYQHGVNYQAADLQFIVVNEILQMYSLVVAEELLVVNLLAYIGMVSNSL